MSLLRRSVSDPGVSPDWVTFSSGRGRVTGVAADRARRHSVVWAGLRLRADLMSSLPVGVYRKSGGIPVEVARPAVMQRPSVIADGQEMTWNEWTYSTSMSLDSTGNAVGLVKAVDGYGYPTLIDLVPDDEVSFKVSRRGKITEYRAYGEKVASRFVWHERQNTVAGVPVGLSPIAYAAAKLAIASGAESFAQEWFQNGAVPSAVLKNEQRTLDDAQAANVKARFLASIRAGEPFVTGRDWTYDPISAKAAESGFIEQQRYTDVDLCRFIGVPASVVDAAVSGSSVTYANLTQDQLFLLVRHIGPALTRREKAWSKGLVRQGQFVKFNEKAFLRLDPETQAKVAGQQIRDRFLAPSEARALDDRDMFTDDQYSEFDRLFGNPNKVSQSPGGQQS